MWNDGTTQDATPVGFLWLRGEYGLRTTKPFVTSYIAPGARRTEVHGQHIFEFYPQHYGRTLDGPISHLRFALRHEPTDLRVLIAAMQAMGGTAIRDWVLSEPSGSFSRRAWFFYETFIGRLEIPDVQAGNYVPAIDPEKHVVGTRKNSSRHRVIDNLLGNSELCPTVRRTARLAEIDALQINAEAAQLLESYDPVTLARAINYLYTKETRSSFAIEGESPTPGKAERFVNALRTASRFQPHKDDLISLQNKIVDPRYAAEDWRDHQNFIGSTGSGYREEVHFICPRERDVESLMSGWSSLTTRLINEVDPVVAAAVSAFAFVFIHPFEDGNGRIHRFLMHHILAKTGYSPEGVVFPISASIVRDQRGYDDILEGFSSHLFRYIEWFLDTESNLVVNNDTRDLYRFFDATSFVEYLGERIVETVRKDLREELDFIAVFDLALESVKSIVDMPDRRAALLVKLCMQNSCRLSSRKRGDFSELTDDEVARIELAIQRAVATVDDRQEGAQPRLI